MVRPLWFTSFWRSLSRNFQRHKVGDDIIHVGGVRKAGERHAGAFDFRLWVAQILAQSRLVPGEIGALHSVGVTKIFQRRRLAAHDALKAWPRSIGLFAVAGG